MLLGNVVVIVVIVMVMMVIVLVHGPKRACRYQDAFAWLATACGFINRLVAIKLIVIQ